MNRYLVGFWADNVYLGYVSIWADNKVEAIAAAREARPWRYADPSLVPVVEKA